MDVSGARTLVEGLAVPWDIAFLPDGNALVTERDSARLLRVSPDGRATAIGTIEGVSAAGEGGLLGVAVSPTYADDQYIFVYFTADDDNRIVRYQLDGDRLSDRQVILSGIPKSGIHNGGRIAFGPDGHLYAGTGEAGDQPLAQDRESLGGKILRMTMDGRPAPGNPFEGSVVWSYGHRNVQGLAWDSQGRMFATEFGQNSFDEINRIEKGANYGWPEVEGVGGDDRFVDPLLTWSTDEASPSGLAYAGGSLWAAALRGARLWQVPLSADGEAGRPIAHFEGEYGRIRAATPAPDGSLWISTSNKDGRGDPDPADDRIIVLPARR
ncbi:glucose/arabinose dehydrogenase [Thermocatellispora tengchongensis]|uniref:Glucose/arabinose dehydrogenase n=1 Tax=Thermocatellispora tengchongensis TaxID=1073253 RepID=A0A840P3U5_9ACTN|nr:PQQ-dependent sugar dehydrogenase [Thermocatellispora tengchongensis]MBB5132573.1 glucose/arabinose dehydrogenase [Thermocatellispora tengchongensis]